MSKERAVPTKSKGLEELLRRKDIWRGYSQAFVAQGGLDTGFPVLNKALIMKGWPESSLIECGQASFAATWILMAHAVSVLLKNRGGLVAMLNPPALPYAAGLLQMGIPTKQLLAINAQAKNDFIACFVELARSPACQAVLAWQPKKKLSYTDLRKCHLATSDSSGIYYLFRHPSALSQASPAPLRMLFSLSSNELILEFVKQRGCLPGTKLELPLPRNWFADREYVDLNELDEQTAMPYLEKYASPSNKALLHKESSKRAQPVRILEFKQLQKNNL